MTREGRRSLAYFVARRPIETQRLGEMGYLGGQRWREMEARDGGERWEAGRYIKECLVVWVRVGCDWG